VVMAGGAVYINGRRVDVETGSAAVEPVRLVLRLPDGSALRSGVQAGSVRTHGALASLEHTSTSADLEAEAADRLQATTVSGDVEADRVFGMAAVQTTSGDVDITEARGPLQVRTVSGDITATAHAAVQAKATSGDIRITAAASVHVSARAVSGDVRVSAAPGACPVVEADSTSGRVRTP